VILLVVYAGCLISQLKTHSDIFNEESKKVEPLKGAVQEDAVLKSLVKSGPTARMSSSGPTPPSSSMKNPRHSYTSQSRSPARTRWTLPLAFAVRSSMQV
jgi:Ca2+/H+ antiporter